MNHYPEIYRMALRLDQRVEILIKGKWIVGTVTKCFELNRYNIALDNGETLWHFRPTKGEWR